MDIIISNNGKPIYEQIELQIKHQIMNDVLKEGDLLPSMRALAKELRISVITTKRAYEDLEREGFLFTVTGKGSFVAPKNLDFLREEHYRQVEQLLSDAIKQARMCGLSREELIEILNMLYEE